MNVYHLKILATVQIQANSEEEAAAKYLAMTARELYVNCLVDDELEEIVEIGE